MPDTPLSPPAAPNAPSQPPLGGGRTLQQKAVRGSAWTFFGYGSTQFIRLAGNIVVTRLLAPEIFGIMAIVWVVQYALTMLSDVGSGLQVVRHERGDDPDFLNTAWTMQVVRGFALFGASCLVAWPTAWLFDAPILFPILIVVGATSIVDGFTTMKLATATRHLALGRQTLIEMLSQTIGVVVMVILAFMYSSIWALVAAAVVSRLVRMLMAQAILPGLTNGFRWERAAVRDLFGFGKWILSSSILNLIAKQLDKPIVGLLDSMAVLGVYNRAGALCDPFHSLNVQISRKIVFPALSSVNRERPEAVRGAFYRARLALDAAFLPLLGCLIVTAPIVVSILYDDRYTAAGWMLQVLLIRVVMQCMLDPGGECLIALNKPHYSFWWTLGRMVWVVIAVPIGWFLAGLPGVIVAVGLSEIPMLGVVWYGMIRYEVFNARRELLAVTMLCAGAAAGWGISLLWGAMLEEQWLLIEAWLRAWLTGEAA